ncbi:C-X-C chemokine receptor type 3-like isoform X1 [Arapaima gigas]
MADYEMAERPSLLQEDLSCPVCRDIYKEPVLLSCTHSFCQACLERSWEQKGVRECPVCRKRCDGEQPIPNRALRNTCESFQKEKNNWVPSGSEVLCGLHRRELQLYCIKDEEPVCIECVTLHCGHELSPLDRGVPSCKEELNIKIQILEEKLELYKKIKRKYQDTSEYIKVQAQQTEVQINAEFEKLRQFLNEEQECRIAELKAEEEKKRQLMKEKIVNVTKDIATLSELIQSVKREMGANDLAFLQVSNLQLPAQWLSDDPQNVPGVLINVAAHLGSLRYKVWEKMQMCVSYFPVTLDPNTASPWVSLSPNLSSVKDNGGRQPLPDNPERFDPCVFVLGSEGFVTGRHRWDVYVGDNPKWILGVCKESVVRKRRFTVTTGAGVWTIGLSKGTYSALSTPRTPLTLDKKPEWIRVKLNMDKGEVSFFDPSDDTHICTFTEKFTERVFPLFGPGLHSTPMSVSPAKVVLKAVSAQVQLSLALTPKIEDIHFSNINRCLLYTQEPATFTSTDLLYLFENYTAEEFDYDNESDTCCAGRVCLTEVSSKFEAVFIPLLYSITLVVGLLGNGLVLAVLCQLRQAWSVTDTFILHLSVADTLLLLTLPFWAAEAVQGWSFGTPLCKLMGAIFKINFYCGIFLLACISLDRYLSIVHAVQMYSRRRSWQVQASCLCVWMICLLLSIPDWIFLEQLHDTRFQAPKCTHNYLGHNANVKDWREASRWLYHIAGFILPSIIMVFCYSRILVQLLSGSQGFKKQRAMRVIVVLVLAFFICWTPYNITLIIDTLHANKTLNETCETSIALEVSLTATSTLGYMHCCLNPILYAFVGVKFRRHLLQMLKAMGCMLKDQMHTSTRKSTGWSVSGDTSYTSGF